MQDLPEKWKKAIVTIVRKERCIYFSVLKTEFKARLKKELNIAAQFGGDESEFFNAVCRIKSDAGENCISVDHDRRDRIFRWLLPVEEAKSASATSSRPSVRRVATEAEPEPKTARDIIESNDASEDAKAASAVQYYDEDRAKQLSWHFDYIGNVCAADTSVDGDNTDGELSRLEQGDVFSLEPSRPFCLVALGVQGSGKSHSLAVFLENMALLHGHRRFPEPPREGKRYRGMCGLVCHYDSTENNVAEVTSLCRYKVGMETPLRVVVYTSPTSFTQRVEYYRSMGYDESLVEVRPLLFEWSKLDVYKLNALMHIDENPSQLYMHVIKSALRRLQKRQKKVKFEEFKDEVLEKLGNPTQCAPLEQRFDVLQEYLWENKDNERFFADYDRRHSITDSVQPNTLIIVDLTDPLLSSFEASSIFALVIDDFSKAPTPTTAEDIYGKAIVLDEAHKYLKKEGALAERVIRSVRLLRHEGLRILVSTQTPKDLPLELLELCTHALLHRFHTPKWYKYLGDQLLLPDDEKGMELVSRLSPGEAILFAGRDWKKIKVRYRLTEDIGRTRI